MEIQSSRAIDIYRLGIIEKVPTPTPEEKVYLREDIKQKLKKAREEKEDYCVQRDIEISDCETILAEMDKKGTIIKPVEVK
jgi:hypothetical protein